MVLRGQYLLEWDYLDGQEYLTLDYFGTSYLLDVAACFEARPRFGGEDSLHVQSVYSLTSWPGRTFGNQRAQRLNATSLLEAISEAEVIVIHNHTGEYNITTTT